MIEKLILDYLGGLMSIPVSVERAPNPPASEYILIERTGGGEEEHIRDATIAVQSYADTMYRAASMMEEIVGHMLNITRLDAVSHVDVNSYYNFTDESEKKYRYQGVFDLVYFPEMI